MKKYIIIIISILAFTKSINAHKEWVHQYLVREAYVYLKYQLNADYPALRDHIGFDFNGYGQVNYPWAVLHPF